LLARSLPGSRPDLIGVTVSRMVESRLGWASPLLRDHGVHGLTPLAANPILVILLFELSPHRPRFGVLWLRSLIRDSLTFVHPVFPLSRSDLLRVIPLDVIPRFTPYRHRRCMEGSGTILDTESTVPPPHTS